MPDEVLVPAAYTLPKELKKRIELMASEQDLNPSQLVRRILREHFERLDAERKAAKKSPQPTAA